MIIKRWAQQWRNINNNLWLVGICSMMGFCSSQDQLMVTLRIKECQFFTFLQIMALLPSLTTRLLILLTPVWKRREGSKNLQSIPTPWGLLGDQYKAFQAIFEILQRQDSETCPDFLCENQLFCQNMSLKTSNPKMIIQNVTRNEKIHIYSQFGAILSIVVDFSFLWQTQDGSTKWKILKSTIVNEITPNLK